MNSLTLFEPFKNDLKKVDQLLLERFSKAIDSIKTPTIQLLNAGGKRTRPLLCLLSSRFGDTDVKKPFELAVAIELIHMSSLVHDDIIDRASLRRGQPTIHKQHTNRHATYIGDYLFAESLAIMTKLKHSFANQQFSITIKKLSMGECAQYQNRYQMNDSIRMYLRKNRDKTARLLGVSCQLGAMISNADKSTQATLYQYGYCLGMSYQIIDDILDFTKPNHVLGKESGQDLIEGYLTIPTLYAMKEIDIYSEIENLFQRSLKHQSADFDSVISQIKQTNAIQQSFKLSQHYLDRALNALKKLPDRPEKETMYHLVGYLSKRNH